MTGEDLRNWRNAVGLTQTELASRIGCSVRTLQEVERVQAFLRTDQQLAVDMASILLAISRRDSAVLTPTAWKAHMALNPFVEERLRASEEADAPAQSQWQGGPELLPAYLAAVRRLSPGLRIDGRVTDYGFRWEVAILTEVRPLVVGVWPKGQRPSPETVAELARDRHRLEDAARQLYLADGKPGRLQIPWEEHPQFAKNEYLRRVGVPGV